MIADYGICLYQSALREGEGGGKVWEQKENEKGGGNRENHICFAHHK